MAARKAPVTVVGTVRADFYDPLIAHHEIQALPPARQVLLGAMPRSELERTIVEPARKVGLEFDPPDLVQRILDEAGEDEGMLPLLEYALKETWALRKGNAMTGDSYARSGGVREAIRITAERTFEALSSQDQQAARQLFLRLVTPGEGQEDTRARAEMPFSLDHEETKQEQLDEAQRQRVRNRNFALGIMGVFAVIAFVLLTVLSTDLKECRGRSIASDPSHTGYTMSALGHSADIAAAPPNVRFTHIDATLPYVCFNPESGHGR